MAKKIVPRGSGVAPVRERGLKYDDSEYDDWRSLVAPVRERGLKLVIAGAFAAAGCRSREGAWIEIG